MLQLINGLSVRSRRVFARKGARRSATLMVVLMLALSSFAAFAATLADAHLAAVGPTSSENHFPVWYKDKGAPSDSLSPIRLELCLDPADPRCIMGDLPNPDAPLHFPDNFPDEAFWFLADGTALDTGNGGRALWRAALEAAFANGGVVDGDQISFARIRIRISGLQAGATYKITHPYGVDEFVAEDTTGNDINFTEDIGIGALGDFSGALGGRIGPFLRWTSGADAGFIGDAATPHAVIGSPFNTNFFRVEGPAGSFTGSTNLCADASLGDDPIATDDCIESDEFVIMGKLATNAGVNADRATYTSSGGQTKIDVFASSEEDQQAIQIVRDPSDLFHTTTMRGDGARYYGRLAYSGLPPATLKVRNAGDNPITEKTIQVIDIVTLDPPVYDADALTLTVHATSSDQSGSPSLTAEGFGPLDSNGDAVFSNVVVPPNILTVTSSKGGFDTEQVRVSDNSAGFPAVQIQAIAGADQTGVQKGQTVTLDGSSSTGDITSFQWTQTSGTSVTLNNANTAIATFEAPIGPADLTFSLKVTGGGETDVDEVSVHVDAVAGPVANAGADQLVVPGSVVTLNGTASTDPSNNPLTFSWVQIAPASPLALLNNANTATPSFTFPVGFNGTFTFRLTVTGPGGSDTDTVNISPTQDTITIARAEFRTGSNRFRVDGTASPGPGNSVSVYLGQVADPANPDQSKRVGTSPVDTTGAWAIDLRNTPPNLRPVSGNVVTVISTRGGVAIATITIRN